jgi:hypothetical protein
MFQWWYFWGSLQKQYLKNMFSTRKFDLFMNQMDWICPVLTIYIYIYISIAKLP